MGFESKKAKKALAESDTGNSVNFESALESLVRERKRDVDGLMHFGYRGNVSERRRRFEEQFERSGGVAGIGGGAGLGEGEIDGVGRPAPLRVGSVRRMASQMERAKASDSRNGVGLGIGGVDCCVMK